MTTWNEGAGENAELWGETLQDLYDEMAAWNLQEVGSCTWQPVLNLGWDDTGHVNSASLTVELQILTPVWARRSDAPDAVRAEWDRWSRALMDHEMGHRGLAYQYLENFEDGLMGKPQADAWAEFEQVKRDLQRASDDYDSSTNHGATQGTTLDTSIT